MWELSLSHTIGKSTRTPTIGALTIAKKSISPDPYLSVLSCPIDGIKKFEMASQGQNIQRFYKPDFLGVVE